MKQLYILLLLIFFSSTISFCQCDNWLHITSDPSYVDVGDVSIAGTQLTIEATFNRTEPYDTGVYDNNDGDLVSKHIDESNVNYLLRPNHAYITTTDGFFATPDACEIELNKTYHVAMVYDGAKLKFYRNGYLISEVAATGSLIESYYHTRIGRFSGTTIETFLGYINQVRIWNIAKTQSELQQYMNTPLPQPTTQTGLLAYYQFNSLKNLQGNSDWDGVLTGDVNINETNPTCASFTADSCKSVLPVVFKDFYGNASNSQVHLWWTILNETNINLIYIERSFDGINYSQLSYVPVKNNSQQNTYEFTDDIHAPESKTVYYRLKIKDRDGHITYSSTLSFNLMYTVFTGIIISPNPARNHIRISCYSQKQERTSVYVTDLSGSILLKQSLNLNTGYNSNILLFSNQLSAGLYFIHVSINGKMFTKKFIVQ